MIAEALPDVVEQETPADRKKKEQQRALILYNDDVHTFEFVISCLVAICGHQPVQAEQCTHLVHFTGRCVVKNGTFQKLRPLCEALIERGLIARIES